MKKIGLIVNPVAGIGGTVALKGSNGELSRKAKSCGGVSPAPRRTIETLQEISRANIDFVMLTYPSAMGEDEAVECEYHPTVLGRIPDETTAEDTKLDTGDQQSVEYLNLGNFTTAFTNWLAQMHDHNLYRIASRTRAEIHIVCRIDSYTFGR